MISDEFVIQLAHNASQKPMQSPRCKHFTYKLGKTEREKPEQTTASNIRGHATPSMPQTMPIPRQLSQESLRVGRWG
jgi:hypothetical protein